MFRPRYLTASSSKNMDTILKDSPFLSKMKVSLLKSGKKDYGDDNS